jgi:hypothetical protein
MKALVPFVGLGVAALGWSLILRFAEHVAVLPVLP